MDLENKPSKLGDATRCYLKLSSIRSNLSSPLPTEKSDGWKTPGEKRSKWRYMRARMGKRFAQAAVVGGQVTIGCRSGGSNSYPCGGWPCFLCMPCGGWTAENVA